jgi:hypothetical protein
MCASEVGVTFSMVQLSFYAACLLYALVLCWQTSEIPTEFAEGSYISLSILCYFQVALITIPLRWNGNVRISKNPLQLWMYIQPHPLPLTQRSVPAEIEDKRDQYPLQMPKHPISFLYQPQWTLASLVENAPQTQRKRQMHSTQ